MDKDLKFADEPMFADEMYEYEDDEELEDGEVVFVVGEEGDEEALSEFLDVDDEDEETLSEFLEKDEEEADTFYSFINENEEEAENQEKGTSTLDAKAITNDTSEFTEKEMSKVQNTLDFNIGKFSTYSTFIEFDDLAYSNPLREYREETYKGLTKSVSEVGIMTPIQVMETESFSSFKADGNNESDFEGTKYILLDGFRRVFAGVKNNLKGCRAVVWVFENADDGRNVSVQLSLLMNRTQKHTWKEIWRMFQVLEMSDTISPSTLEFYLQLEPGDAMKLKDIMLSDYADVKQDLLDDKKNISQSYNALQKARKEEDQLVLDDGKGISQTEEGEEVSNETEREKLSDDQVKEILEMASEEDVDFSDATFEEWSGEERADLAHDRKAGERIDENLRISVLERDKYTCQVSGFGKGLPINLVRPDLNVHHKVPISLGGPDTLDNLITLSSNFHNLIHRIAETGKLGISKEDFDKLDETTKETYRNVMKYVNIILLAKEKAGAKELPKHKPIRKAYWEK